METETKIEMEIEWEKLEPEEEGHREIPPKN